MSSPSPNPSGSGSSAKAQPPSAFKVKKIKKAGSRKPASGRPTTLHMVIQAIGAMKDRKGSSAQAIRKYITAHYPGIPENFMSSMLKRAFAAGLKSGALVRPKTSSATGASGRFRIGKVAKPKKAAPKKKAAKPKKSGGKKKIAKKSTNKAKKMKKAKSIKRKSTTKKTKTTKKVTKKVKPSKKSAKARPMKSNLVKSR